jgi:hypothetical protein
MRRWWSAGATLAVALTVALVWLAVGALSDDELTGRPAVAASTPGPEDPAEPGNDRGRVAAEGHGPPPWAHGPGGRDGAPGKAGKRSWHAAWKAMSPRERERTMTRLAEEHAAGMRAWAACVADGRDDCEKPLPPGLAKRQSGR